MRLLVFQHIDCEHPGMLRTFLEEDAVAWDAVELDQGETIPDLDPYDALWVMGGPMDVWEEEAHPWLIPEKQAIRTWVRDLGRPFLGICLGHQLLADALGGCCGPQRPPEIGICDVELTDAGSEDPIFAGMPRRQRCLQWHSVQVEVLPEESVVLASSSICRVQAMRVGPNAWSLQYHVEVEPDTVDNWAVIPAYRSALDATLGPGAVDEMREQATRRMIEFNRNTRQLYQNFRRASGL